MYSLSHSNAYKTNLTSLKLYFSMESWTQIMVVYNEYHCVYYLTVLFEGL